MDFRIFENDQYVSITQEWNAWQGDTVCEAAVRGHLLLIAHLKARTEDVGNSGPLACHISTSAQDTILFIWFAFRLCPLTSGYSKLEDTSQPRQSLSSVKSKSFIWAQLGWRKKKKTHPVLGMPLLLFTSIWVTWKRDSRVWMILSSGGVVYSNVYFNLQCWRGGNHKTIGPLWPQSQKIRDCFFYRRRRQVG